MNYHLKLQITATQNSQHIITGVFTKLLSFFARFLIGYYKKKQTQRCNFFGFFAHENRDYLHTLYLVLAQTYVVEVFKLITELLRVTEFINIP